MIAGVERADVLGEASEDIAAAVKHIEQLLPIDPHGVVQVVSEDLKQVAGRLGKLAALEVFSAASPPKHKNGDVVFLRSSRPHDAAMTIINVHESTGENAPVMYECLIQARDGSGLLSVRLPEYALASFERAAEIYETVGDGIVGRPA